MVHNAIYARQYARHAAAAGMNFACFFTDYHGMTADDIGDSRYTVVSSRYHRVTSYNLLSDFPATGSDWTETKQALSFAEQLRGAYQPRTSQNQLVRPRSLLASGLHRSKSAGDGCANRAWTSCCSSAAR